MEPLLMLSVGLYALVAIILAALVYTYGKTALSTRAAYPIGLLIFSLLLLVQSAGTALGYVLFGDYIGDEAYPFMLGMSAAELVGVAALFRITV